jgi:hypothetical protein
MTGPGDGYDSALSALRNGAENLAVALATWQARDDTKPDAHARRCASDAVDAILPRPPGPFGMFGGEAEHDEWVAQRDAAIAAEATRWSRAGITDAEDLATKYSALCDLFERAWHGLPLTPGPGDIGMTSDEARAEADRMLGIMNGGPWRVDDEADADPPATS